MAHWQPEGTLAGQAACAGVQVRLSAASHSAYSSVRERPHLDRATPATSPQNHTHVLVHWELESCLRQGLEIPATEPARADSDMRAEHPLRRGASAGGPGQVTECRKTSDRDPGKSA